MVSEIVMAIISAGFGVFLGYQAGKHKNYELRENNKRLMKKNEYMTNSLEYWTDEYYEKAKQVNYYKAELRKYEQAYREIVSEINANKKSNIDVDADICKAIKYAMTNSHPDKPNGNSEDFIKFHRLYKKYCK